MSIIDNDDSNEDDFDQVFIALVKIVSRLNALQPDPHLQATLARAQRIIERSMSPDMLKEININ
jgi:hypothetical protein